jgi:thymidylate kinase
MKSVPPVIAVVGPCAAGKTTLAETLTSWGYQVRQVAQEHSYVPDMWQVIAKPDFLIYLDVSYQISISRSKNAWKESIFNRQIERLAHAKKHADLYLHTDSLTIEEIRQRVREALQPRFRLPEKNLS